MLCVAILVSKKVVYSLVFLQQNQMTNGYDK